MSLDSIDVANPIDLARLAMSAWPVVSGGTSIARRLWRERRTRTRPTSPPDDPSDNYVI